MTRTEIQSETYPTTWPMGRRLNENTRGLPVAREETFAEAGLESVPKPTLIAPDQGGSDATITLEDLSNGASTSCLNLCGHLLGQPDGRAGNPRDIVALRCLLRQHENLGPYTVMPPFEKEAQEILFQAEIAYYTAALVAGQETNHHWPL
jgi:hypothetical protein